MFAEEKLAGCRGEVWQCQVPGPLGHINISSALGINKVIVTPDIMLTLCPGCVSLHYPALVTPSL